MADGSSTEDRKDNQDKAIPTLMVVFSSYRCTVGAGTAFERFGGVEQYDNGVPGSRSWTFDSPETPQELLQRCITKYKGEEYALAWFDFLDSKTDGIDDGNPLSGFFSTYAVDNHDMDAYALIEREWIESHGLSDMVEDYRHGKMAALPEMKDADDDEWRDAFILNIGDQLAAKPKREAAELNGQAQDLIDDLALIYMGIGIYAGTRKYDMIKAYAV